MKRIPPSSKLRQEVEEVFIGWETEGHPLDNFVRLGPDDEVHIFREVTEQLDISRLDSYFNDMGQHPYHPRMRGEFDYGYNAQAGVEEGHGVIV